MCNLLGKSVGQSKNLMSLLGNGLTWSEDFEKNFNHFSEEKVSQICFDQPSYFFIWCQIGSGVKFVPVSNWLFCTLGAKLVRCQIGTGAKLTPLHSWCQIGTGAKLTLLHSWCQIDLLTLLVPNWLRCQIGTGAKLSSNHKNQVSLFRWVFQMFFAAYLFPAFLVISPAEGIVGGVKAQNGQFPYIVSFCF